MSKIARALGPLGPGEERITDSRSIPGMTRKDISDHQAREILDRMQANLDLLVGYEVVFGPTLIRETVTGDGIDTLVLTAVAIVKRQAEERRTMQDAISYPSRPVMPQWLAGALRDPAGYAARMGGVSEDELRRMRESQEKIRAYVFRAAEQQNARLEQLADEMLVDPAQRGIAIVQDRDATLSGLNNFVPWGHVYEFPSIESYMSWIERGNPVEDVS